MSAPLLAGRDLSLSFGRRRILDGISIDISPGDYVALLGQNGSGKTSLLRLLLGLLDPTEGHVLLQGTALEKLSRREIARNIAYVPQAHVPTFPYTVREIVGMGRSATSGWGRRLGAADEVIISSALASLRMSEFQDRIYAELSGGERQAVLIARALAQEARIILMDEPVSSLDLAQRARLLTLLTNLAALGYAIVVSLHQPELAMRCFNRAILLHERRILDDGHPNKVLTSDNLSRLYGVEVVRFDVSDGMYLSTSTDYQAE